ncbi:MAG: DUF5672 family protein [Sphingomicrobium sp.]
MNKLSLPGVTVCAAASVNLPATLAALQACLDQIDFAECLLFTDKPDLSVPPQVRVVPIPRLRSAADYSALILRDLAEHVRTDHCLVVQWDGFVLDSAQWDPSFLEFDYIGARWPQFDDGHDVGNGGFSLRSRKLLEACRDSAFQPSHPEDIAIGRLNRSSLEQRHNIRFASGAVADLFAFERSVGAGPTFGFHGIFNMIPALGADRFWEIYRSLDEPGSAFVDYRLLVTQLSHGQHAWRRRLKMTFDWLKGARPA